MSLFSNDSVQINSLPSLVEGEFEGLPSRYRTLRAAVYFVVMLFVFAAMGVLMWFEWWQEGRFGWRVWVALVTVVAFGSIWAIEEIKGFPMRGVVVREHDLSYRSGFFKRETVTVPFNRIQHSEIAQGPVARVFSVCTLKLYTAGHSGANLRVPGMDVERAKRLRQQLDERVSQL
ncbi:MAG TPA: hypothetical protein DD635_06785 [Flavobacteriales bacterium]|nr:hypothetical protein [Flavobacteriales bacterium]|tara:strand:+ start:3870 stop:4394 length:525 start_codon:yes stop_codon:yes gene_type:complete